MHINYLFLCASILIGNIFEMATLIYTALYFKLYKIFKYFLQDPNMFMFCSSFKIVTGREKASHRDASGNNVNL